MEKGTNRVDIEDQRAKIHVYFSKSPTYGQIENSLNALLDSYQKATEGLAEHHYQIQLRENKQRYIGRGLIFGAVGLVAGYCYAKETAKEISKEPVSLQPLLDCTEECIKDSYRKQSGIESVENVAQVDFSIFTNEVFDNLLKAIKWKVDEREKELAAGIETLNKTSWTESLQDAGAAITGPMVNLYNRLTGHRTVAERTEEARQKELRKYANDAAEKSTDSPLTSHRNKA